MQYEAVIGLEIHAQLNTQSKLFCTASAAFGADPNDHVSPVSLGLPGALPVLNKKAVEYAIIAGLALNSTIQRRSVFARKNYFYPDLPKGYQISQYEHPICLGGQVALDGMDKTIHLTRIHIEEDAGKLNHQGADGIAGASGSLVDLNRAGVPLIEIVSEPEIRSPKEARAYMEKVHQILTFVGVCDGNLENGSLRCDANVSIRPVGLEAFGTRTEVKNLNSFRSVERAVSYEISRQTSVLDSGGTIRQQTLHYNDTTGKTVALRDKENAHDYRYFPDPDLKPLIISEDQLNQVKQSMGRLPDDVRQHYRESHDLPLHDIKVFLQERRLYDFFEASYPHLKRASLKDMSKWVVGDLNAQLKIRNDHHIPIKPDAFAMLIDQCHDGEISTKMLKDLLPIMLDGVALSDAMDQLGGGQISNEEELTTIVQHVLDAHPDVVKKIQGGKVASANFLMGQVMKQTKGRAKPDAVRDLILRVCQGD
tara:strand:- start:2985 stop:4424 length:1440 start_codon:yes stop_codon:yes gene_type:complete